MLFRSAPSKNGNSIKILQSTRQLIYRLQATIFPFAFCRYADFHVNEIDLDGNIVHLTSFDLPTSDNGNSRAIPHCRNDLGSVQYHGLWPVVSFHHGIFVFPDCPQIAVDDPTLSQWIDSEALAKLQELQNADDDDSKAKSVDFKVNQLRPSTQIA